MTLTGQHIEKYYQLLKYNLEKAYPQWLCTLEQDVMVIQWNTRGATYFNGTGITRQQDTYRYIIKIFEDGTFKGIDCRASQESTIGLGGIHLEASVFKGYMTQSTTEIYLGKNNQSGEAGIQHWDLSTDKMKKAVHDCLESMGLRPTKLTSAFSNAYLAAALAFIGIPGLLMLIFIPMISSGITGTSYVNGVEVTSEPLTWANAWPMVAIPAGIMIFGLVIILTKYQMDKKAGQTQ